MRWCESAEQLTNTRTLGDGIVEWALEHITDGLFVDGGACVGLFCIPVLLARPEAHCVAFEPNPVAAAALQEMAELNGISERLTVHAVALLDYEGVQTLKVPAHPRQSGLATLGEPERFAEYHTETVTTQILDSYKLEPQLIKLDLEGAELHALTGAVETIMRYHPAIVTEAHAPNTAQFGYQAGEIEKYLATLGYHCQRGREDLFCTI